MTQLIVVLAAGVGGINVGLAGLNPFRRLSNALNLIAVLIGTVAVCWSSFERASRDLLYCSGQLIDASRPVVCAPPVRIISQAPSFSEFIEAVPHELLFVIPPFLIGLGLAAALAPGLRHGNRGSGPASS